jgi:hypothetical protein
MTPKNARTEARGFLGKFAGRSAEFQWEIVLIHGGRDFVCLYTRQIQIGPRRGQMQEFLLWANQKSDLPRRITGSPRVFLGWEWKVGKT